MTVPVLILLGLIAAFATEGRLAVPVLMADQHP
jgi:hypothetical protein